jgi:hypothetical protein
VNALAVLKLVLSLASTLASYVREKGLMNAGEAKATARSLAALSERLGIAQEVAREVAAMSDADLDAELRGD